MCTRVGEMNNYFTFMRHVCTMHVWYMRLYTHTHARAHAHVYTHDATATFPYSRAITITKVKCHLVISREASLVPLHVHMPTNGLRRRTMHTYTCTYMYIHVFKCTCTIHDACTCTAVHAMLPCDNIPKVKGHSVIFAQGVPSNMRRCTCMHSCTATAAVHVCTHLHACMYMYSMYVHVRMHVHGYH